MANVYAYATKEKSLFMVSYRYNDQKGVVRQTMKRGFTTKREANAFARQTEGDYQNKAIKADDKFLLGDYLDRWLEDQTLKETSADGYKINIKHIKNYFGKMKLIDLRDHHIKSFYKQLAINGRMQGKGGLSNTSIKYIHRIFSKALKAATFEHLIRDNPIANVPTPKIEKYDAVFYNQQEVHLLLQAVKDTNWELPVRLALALGLRRGEVLGLTWDKINFTKNTVRINSQLVKTSSGVKRSTPKSKRSIRTLYFIEPLSIILTEHKNLHIEKSKLANVYHDNNLVCAKQNGESLSPNEVSEAFLRLVRQNNLRQLRFHDLRHTYASMAIDASVDLKTLSELLGHSSISITADTYGHLYEGKKRISATMIYDQIFGTDSPSVLTEN